MTVEQAIKTLQENGYVTDLLYNRLDGETAILTAAEEDGIDVTPERLKELTTTLLGDFEWESYSQNINDDLEREAARLLKGTKSFEESWFDAIDKIKE